MRLLLHDTLATAPFVIPLTESWVPSGVPFEVSPALAAAAVEPDAAALLPAAEIAHLRQTHRIVPDIAVVAGNAGTVAMRAPVRPDGVDRTPVRLYECSGTAELLARATLGPFYGIEAATFVRGDESDAATAQVVIVEGAAALQPPEAGFAEDLCRAWFILTGEPAVTHLLVVPTATDRESVKPLLGTLGAARDVAHERRTELRRLLAERHGLDRDRLAALHAAQRLALDPEDRLALVRLLQRGNRGSAYPYVWDVDYLEPDGE